MKHLITLYLLLVYASLWSQNDSTRFVIRTSGFQSWNDYNETKDSIARNWDLTYLPVAGCLVSDELIDSINQLNNITYKRLEVRYGPDWEDRFNRAVDSAYTSIQNQKENTYRETANCTTAYCSFKAFENLSQTGMKFKITPKKGAYVNHEDIHLTGLQHIDPTILYRGYENLIALEFGTFTDTGTISIKSRGYLSLSDTCLTSSKINFSYRVSGSIKYDTLLIETSKGQILPYVFKVQNLEPPHLYFNDQLLDSTLKIAELNTKSVLSMRLKKTCLIPDVYTIHTWEIWHSNNKRYVGRGNQIPTSITRKLKKLKAGSQCCIQVTVSQKDCILRKKIVCVTLI